MHAQSPDKPEVSFSSAPPPSSGANQVNSLLALTTEGQRHYITLHHITLHYKDLVDRVTNRVGAVKSLDQVISYSTTVDRRHRDRG